jgi:nitrogen fixation protein FixH
MPSKGSIMLQKVPIATAGGHHAETNNSDGWRLTGPKFLAILLGSFAAVAAVNATMIYYAEKTFSGEVDPHPYEHGLAYNKDIVAAEAQDARHWQVAGHVSGGGITKTVEAVFRDNANHPLPGLAVTAKLEFATDMNRDHTLALTESTPGVYRGTIAATSGQWDLVLEAKRDAKQVFRSRNRITIP